MHRVDIHPLVLRNWAAHCFSNDRIKSPATARYLHEKKELADRKNELNIEAHEFSGAPLVSIPTCAADYERGAGCDGEGNCQGALQSHSQR